MKKLLPLLALLPMLMGCAADAPLDLDRMSPEHFEKTIRAMLLDSAPYEGRTLTMTGYYVTADGLQFLLRTDEAGQPLGLELQWSGSAPQPGDEVTARGQVVTYEQDGMRYLALAAQSLRNRSAWERGLDYPVDGAEYLPRLAALYDAPEDYLGAKVTVSGRLFLRAEGPTVERSALYLDGSSAQVGLAFETTQELPEEGAWVTVTGLVQVRNGAPYLESAELVCGAGGQEQVLE